MNKDKGYEIYCTIAFIGDDGSLIALNFETEELAKDFIKDALWDRSYLVGNINRLADPSLDIDPNLENVKDLDE